MYSLDVICLLPHEVVVYDIKIFVTSYFFNNNNNNNLLFQTMVHMKKKKNIYIYMYNKIQIKGINK